MTHHWTLPLAIAASLAASTAAAATETLILRDSTGRRVGTAHERYDGQYTLRDKDGRRIGSVGTHPGSNLRPTDSYRLRSAEERQVDRLIRQSRRR